MAQSHNSNSRFPHTPKYRRQKVAKGQDRAFVVLDGKRIYLGPYNSKESREKYHRLLAEWAANGYLMPAQGKKLAVVELIRVYWRHVRTAYTDDSGKPSQHAKRIRVALRPVRRLYARVPVVDFGPLALKAVRQEFIEQGLARNTVNDYVGLIRNMFKWAVEEELAPGSVNEALQAVSGLKKSRSEARETEPVRPVCLDRVSSKKSADVD